MKKTYFRQKPVCPTQKEVFTGAVQKTTFGKLLLGIVLKQRIKPGDQDSQYALIAPESEYLQPITWQQNIRKFPENGTT